MRQSFKCLAGSLGLACGVSMARAASVQQTDPPAAPVVATPVVATPVVEQPPQIKCDVDLELVGSVSDIVSNVLLRAEHKPEIEVESYLAMAKKTFATSDDLRKAAADHFKIDQERFAKSVDHWRHINCKHAAIPGYQVPDAARQEARLGPIPPVAPSDFAADVTLHVVLHELGHAVIREFDLLVLGNEETMADAFATHLLTEHFPEHAVRAISARVKSLMIEAGEVPRDQWTVHGEHDSDARRAYQIAALAIAANKDKFAGVAQIVGMTERDISSACDYGADIHRAWRRTLSPLLMPAGKSSKESRLRTDAATCSFVEAGEPSLASTIMSALERIDWHSQVTVEFVGDAQGAGWNRSKRTITVGGEYLRRFVAQAVKAEAQAEFEAAGPRRLR